MSRARAPRWFRQLDRLVRRHLVPPAYPGFAGLVRVQPAARVRQFGPVVLSREQALQRAADDGPDRRWWLSPAAETVLFPDDTTVRLRHADGALHVGFDVPGQDGPLRIADPKPDVFVFADPDGCPTVVADRLRTRAWAPVRGTG